MRIVYSLYCYGYRASWKEKQNERLVKETKILDPFNLFEVHKKSIAKP